MMKICVWIDGEGERCFELVDEFRWDCYDGLTIVCDEGSFYFANEQVNCGDFEKL